MGDLADYLSWEDMAAWAITNGLGVTSAVRPYLATIIRHQYDLRYERHDRAEELSAKVANLREWLEEETEREVALLEPVLHRTVQAIVAERPDVGGCIQ